MGLGGAKLVFEMVSDGGSTNRKTARKVIFHGLIVSHYETLSIYV